MFVSYNVSSNAEQAFGKAAGVTNSKVFSSKVGNEADVVID